MQKQEMPLLSASDVRLLLINKFAETSQKKFTIEQQIKNRHRLRQMDIDNRYQKEIELLQVWEVCQSRTNASAINKMSLNYK